MPMDLFIQDAIMFKCSQTFGQISTSCNFEVPTLSIYLSLAFLSKVPAIELFGYGQSDDLGLIFQSYTNRL